MRLPAANSPLYNSDMFIPRKYDNPPIREAIFTIAFRDAIGLEVLNKFLETSYVKKSFPTRIPGYSVNINALTPDISTNRTLEGFTLRPGDKANRLIQVKPMFLSYHNLTKYDGWDVMINELKVLWSEFCDSLGKISVSEVRVRNINEINLPLPPGTRLNEYLKLLPAVPSGINPGLGNFFLQIHTTDPEKGLGAIVSESMAGYTPGKQQLKILLDITVFKKGINGNADVEIWDAFLALREYKDDIFIKCITDKTEKLFNNE